MSRLKKSLIVLLSLLTGTAIFGTGYVFAHGGDVNIIHACVKTNNLRIIDANASCDQNETPLDWNIQGPKGDKGDPGEDGKDAVLPFICTACRFTNNSVDLEIRQGDYKDAILNQTQFSGSELNGADFTKAQLTSARFVQSHLINATYVNADLRLAIFQEATLDTVNFSNANLKGAREFDSATLTNITWSNTTCPDGTNSNDNGNTCEGHLTP